MTENTGKITHDVRTFDYGGGMSADLDPPASPFSRGPVAERSLGELRAELVELAEQRTRLDAREAAVLGRFEALGGPAHDGARSTAAWLRSRTCRSGRVAGAVARRARALRRCAVVAEAHAAGRLGTEHVAALVRARDGFEDRFAEHEAELVALVEPLTVDQAVLVLRRWRHLAEAEAASAGGEEPPVEARSEVHLRAGIGGRGLLEADLDPLFHAELQGAIDAELDLLFRRPERAAEVDGDGEVVADARAEARAELAEIRDRIGGRDLTQAERVGYALQQVVRRGMRAGQHHQAPRPSVTVIVDVTTAAHRPYLRLAPATGPARSAADEASSVAAAEVPAAAPASSTWEDAQVQLCELAGSGPISRHLADRILCSCDAVALAWDPEANEILDLGRSTRTPNAHQRRALRRRDGGCVFPGCAVGADRCDAHHVIPWTNGGPTDLRNLVLLCAYHHHAVHERGFLLLRPDGVVKVWRPDGSQLPAPPPGHRLPLDPPDPEPAPSPRPPWVGRPRPGGDPPSDGPARPGPDP